MYLYVLVHDYTLCCIGSNLWHNATTIKISLWPQYVAIHLDCDVTNSVGSARINNINYDSMLRKDVWEEVSEIYLST